MAKMQMREIGSEFHYSFIKKNSSLKNDFNFNDGAFTFSGRTAIETVLKNIQTAKKALVPSYCCDSILEPFRNADICIEFYDVYYKDGLKIKLNISDDVDLILWCNYFGFCFEMPDFSSFLNKGGIIIEDITHSFLSNSLYNSQSEYVVASLRKWFPLLSGGFCGTTKNLLKYKPNKEVPKEFLELKKTAMLQKSLYLSNGDVELKKIFLNNFSISNKWLSSYYSELKIDSESSNILMSIDFDDIRRIRRGNASCIYDFLNKQKNITPLFKEEDMDCPLFVPIIFKSAQERDLTRQKLIEKGIYCPIHWPKPNLECVSNLYDLELSLICDQRYNLDDVKYMMNILCDF